MAVSVFLDTSVLLAGLVDFGPQSAPAQSLLAAVADKRIGAVATAWHCCLEFFSVATRLPPEYRIGPSDAAMLLEQEVFARMMVHVLPASERLALLNAAVAGRDCGWTHLRCSHRRDRPRGGCCRRRHRQQAALPLGASLRHARGDAGRVPVQPEDASIVSEAL